MENFAGKQILIGICGGIAAYKVCPVISQLFQQGASVRVVLTDAAQAFITPLTVATLSRHQAYTDQDFWQSQQPRPLHIVLGERADVLLIAPLTAQTLAKLTHGLADNLLTNTVLASRCPVLCAPAMNTDMWEQPVVQRNVTQLTQDSRFQIIAPNAGLLACDRRGQGRLAEPEHILHRLQALLFTKGKADLADKTIVITAGGTQEYIDAVRFIGNPSTGRMGIALAQAAADRGATVILIHAPLTGILIPPGIQTVSVTNAEQMGQALNQYAPQADWVIMAAAVADVKPQTQASGKLPKQALPFELPLAPVPDLIAAYSAQKLPQQLLVGFAAQSGDIISPAQAKLQRKQLDIIVANPIDQPDAGFGSAMNQAIILDRHGQQQVINPCSKLAMAHQILQYCRSFKP